jgi:hypothetical protein
MKTLAIVGFTLFFIAIFPIKLTNYIYFNSRQGYASINVRLYSILNIFNASTIKNSLNRMIVNGRERRLQSNLKQATYFKIIKAVHITKLIQLKDAGLKSNTSVVAALSHNALTNYAYGLLQAKNPYTKLGNYVVYNHEHDSFNYIAKVSIAVNIIIIAKIAFYILMEKIK